VRSNAFVSGGLVPAAMRGKALDGLIGIEDWYRTFCGLAGVDPEDARGNAAGLPPVEGYDQWPLLSGANSTPPRTEVWLGADSPRDGGAGGRGSGASQTFVQGLIRADGWKVLHDVITQDIWQGPFYPNATTLNKPWDNAPLDCGSFAKPTCLFNVFSDPTEHDNQADKQPSVLAEMVSRLAEIQTTVFSPNRGQQSPLACEVSKNNGGFVAPFLP
jgi:arylsulfatase B